MKATCYNKGGFFNLNDICGLSYTSFVSYIIRSIFKSTYKCKKYKTHMTTSSLVPES